MAQSDDRLQHAVEIACRYLNRRERTVLEVRRHLKRLEVEQQVLERAIHVLTEQGLIDDSRFVRLFAQDKQELEDWGSERIRRTLLQRGVDRELIEDVLGGTDPELEQHRALDLLRRRFPSPPRTRTGRNKALGVILRKGYDVDVAVAALDAYAHAPSEANLQ